MLAEQIFIQVVSLDEGFPRADLELLAGWKCIRADYGCPTLTKSEGAVRSVPSNWNPNPVNV